MSPRQTQNDVWVSDEESIEEQTLSVQQAKASIVPYWRKQVGWALWRERLKRLTRVGIRVDTRPPVGQLCLVMVGKMEQGQGQVGIVTRQTACMVELTMCAGGGEGHTVAHLKRPSSLIFLEQGLVLVQDENGSVWLRHQPHESDKSYTVRTE